MSYMVGLLVISWCSTARLARAVADDGRPLHAAHRGPVVGHRIVLAGAVVPEGEGAGTPAEPTLVFGDGGAGVEPGEQSVRFGLLHPDHVLREGGVDVDRPGAGLGMGAHD